MKFDTTTAAIVAFAAAASAVSSIETLNHCAEGVYLTVGSNGQTNGPFMLPSGEAFNNSIIGQGNTLIVSKVPDIYLQSTAKLDFGTSTSGGILYWSVNDVNGDPFAGESWDVTSYSATAGTNVCGDTTTYGDRVYACADQYVALYLNLC